MDREVRLVATGERVRLAFQTPCVSEPAGMDYEAEARTEAEGPRGPVVVYRAMDGSTQRAEMVRTSLGVRFAGDAVLIPDGDDRWLLGEVLP